MGYRLGRKENNYTGEVKETHRLIPCGIELKRGVAEY